MYKVVNLNFSIAMQMKKVIFVALFVIGFVSLNAQIKINEYNISNKVNADALVPPGNPDYVEIFNAQLTPQSFSVNVYYLTNDKTNLFKWKIPGAITLPPGGFVTFWCDGKDVKEPGVAGRYHTNFDIKQCKDKWLMLVRNNGVIADSVLIRQTKIGDTWGKYPDGSNIWRLFSGGSAFFPDAPNISNPPANVYFGYAPTPVFMAPPGWPGATPANFFAIGDTVNFEIHYTISDCQTWKDGTAPCLTMGGCPTAPITYTYVDDAVSPLSPPYPFGVTEMIRAITIPKPSNTSNTIIGTPAYYTYTPTIAQMYLPSFVETNTYFDGADITVNPGFGVLSVASPSAYPEVFAGTVLFPPAGGTTLHVEYFDKLKQYSEGYANLTKPVNDTWVNEQKAFNVGLDDETGFGCEITGQVFNDPTFGVSNRNILTDFAVKCAGVDNFTQLTPSVTTAYTLPGTHMRDAFVQTYAITNNLNLDGLHYKPIKTFVNGCYWGVYEFRELADVNYTNYYYKHHKDSTDILGTYAGNLIMAGQDTAWFTTPVLTFTTGVFNQVQTFYNVMNVAKFYQKIIKRIDQKSFMDFMIYNSYLVNADLMGLNNSWWRGFTPSILKNDSSSSKWRYFMWDMNNVLGLNLTPKTLPTSSTNMSVTPCIYTQGLAPVAAQNTPAAAYNGHGFILKALLQNVQFKNDYLNRWMDLLNTTLRCDKLLAHFQYFRNIFTPEMNNHVTSPVPWATINFSDWDANMDTLKQRITTRCALTQSLLAKPVCYNFNGPYTINIDVKPVGSGNVNFNSLQLSSYVWSGTYYQNKLAPYLLSYLKATPIDTNKYIFDHWEWTACCTNSTTASPAKYVHQNLLGADSIAIVISSSDNITAVFTDRRNDIVLPTGFTPNGDGLNDVFSPLGPGTRFARDYEFQVWNRWGQEVYRSADVHTGWDGSFNGDQAQTGVYAYLIKYKNILNEYKQIKGNVTLIR